VRPTLGGPLKLGQSDLEVARALRTTATLRWLAGFLLFFGAFVVQQHGIGGLNHKVALAELAVGIGVGNVLGTVVGARTAPAAGHRLGSLLLVVTALSTLLTALDFGLLTVFTVAVVSSAAASLAKLALDATIQQRIAEEVRTSTFGRSETTLQLAWVIGGGVGIVLPTKPFVGFIVATAVIVLVLVGTTGRSVGRGRSSVGARPDPSRP
jgi:hypothetical protein